MSKIDAKSKKESIEEPLIDQSNEGLKKLILKGKRKGFLQRSECEKALSKEKFEDREEFYSKVESLNIQIYDEETDENSIDETEEAVVSEKDEDTGRTDDPVRMYLKEMGNVELLSRIGEIEIEKSQDFYLNLIARNLIQEDLVYKIIIDSNLMSIKRIDIKNRDNLILNSFLTISYKYNLSLPSSLFKFDKNKFNDYLLIENFR